MTDSTPTSSPRRARPFALVVAAASLPMFMATLDNLVMTNALPVLHREKELASMTNATLPRLSHVISRLEARGLVRRERNAADARATDAVITADGRRKVLHATPGHVETVRHVLLDVLTPEQAAELREITAAVLVRLDPDGRMAASRPR